MLIGGRLRGRPASRGCARGRRAARPPDRRGRLAPSRARRRSSRRVRRPRGSARRAARSRARAARSSAAATSVTSSGASPFVGSSTSSTGLSFRSARAIATICCWPPESVPARCPAAGLELGKELVDELVPGGAVSLGEPEVLVDREPGKDVSVLRDVADPAADDRVRAQSGELLAAEGDAAGTRHEAEQRPHRRRLADAVSAEERRDPALLDVERHALEDVRLAEVDVQVVDADQRAWLGRDRHQSGSPR